MTHPNYTVAGQIYDCSHLAPTTHAVDWTRQDGSKVQYEVLLRYSSHCYSREVTKLLKGDVQVPDRALRIFCPKRHADSLDAVGMVQRLVHKPGAPVGQTQEKNWSTYRIYARAPKGERYYVFFRLRPLDLLDLTKVDVYVESAYKRGHVGVTKNAAFGRAIEMMFG